MKLHQFGAKRHHLATLVLNKCSCFVRLSKCIFLPFCYDLLMQLCDGRNSFILGVGDFSATSLPPLFLRHPFLLSQLRTLCPGSTPSSTKCNDGSTSYLANFHKSNGNCMCIDSENNLPGMTFAEGIYHVSPLAPNFCDLLVHFEDIDCCAGQER